MRKLFCGCNSPKGFVGFYDRLVDMYDLKRLYILKGGSGIGKSTFIKKFGERVGGRDIDWLFCVDGTSPHMIDPIYSGIADEIVNLGEFIIMGKPKADKAALKALRAKKAQGYKLAAAELCKIHKHAHKASKALQTRLYGEVVSRIRGVSGQKLHVHMFARSITADGVVDLYNSLGTAPRDYFHVNCCPYLASAVFKKVHEEFGGYAFHSFMYPDMIEGIQAGAVVFSTHPIPDCQRIDYIGDSRPVVDFVAPRHMEQATKHLFDARETHEQIEQLYQGAVEWDGVWNKFKSIIKEYVHDDG
jgi:hypothetical protein